MLLICFGRIRGDFGANARVLWAVDSPQRQVISARANLNLDHASIRCCGVNCDEPKPIASGRRIGDRGGKLAGLDGSASALDSVPYEGAVGQKAKFDMLDGES